MASLATYNTYRKIGRELNTKIVKAALNRDALDRAAKLLGMFRGGVLVFDSEEETAFLFDLALHDFRAHHKNAIELYRDTVGAANEIETDLLSAWASAYTSLF